MGSMALRDHLLRSPLFDGVGEDAARFAEAATTELRFDEGENLVTQEARGEALFFVTSGRARVVRAGLGGRERTVAFLYAPAVFGELAVLSGAERSATVIADTPVRALVLYRDHFEALVARYPRVLWNLARVLAERVSVLNDELIAAGISTEASMIHAFLQLHDQRALAGEEAPADLPLGPSDLMRRLSSSRETVHRVLRKLQREKLVEAKESGVRLLDVEALRELVDGLEE